LPGQFDLYTGRRCTILASDTHPPNLNPDFDSNFETFQHAHCFTNPHKNGYAHHCSHIVIHTHTHSNSNGYSHHTCGASHNIYANPYAYQHTHPDGNSPTHANLYSAADLHTNPDPYSYSSSHQYTYSNPTYKNRNLIYFAWICYV
jgi:hypothetical protein